MEAELIGLYEAAKKAADAVAADGVEESSPEEDRCVDALKQLKKFPVNYQLLVSTQVYISLSISLCMFVCVCVCVMLLWDFLILVLFSAFVSV